MKLTYKHTNIIARDWRALALFYQRVFDCQPVPPERDQAGDWLSRGTGVANARLQGAHLRLPGSGDSGPTLEIYQYGHVEEKPQPLANREGFSHIAFETDDVPGLVQRLIENGGSLVGEISETTVDGVGKLTFVYAADPEGNIIELQAWG